ncbi:hypothetical protein CSA37_07790 [Candidatus Fermentibacteria bacterium]|nr:MAG: hypothetical protein CSA37_07790 [Candidatus Fermentibacteria bacterium]
MLHSPGFVDKSPAQVLPLNEDGEYFCSLRTMCRILPIGQYSAVASQGGNFTGEYLSTAWNLQLSTMLQAPVDETDSSLPQWRGKERRNQPGHTKYNKP